MVIRLEPFFFSHDDNLINVYVDFTYVEAGLAGLMEVHVALRKHRGGGVCPRADANVHANDPALGFCRFLYFITGYEPSP